MASAELSRRVEKVVGYPALSEMTVNGHYGHVARDCEQAIRARLEPGWNISDEVARAECENQAWQGGGCGIVLRTSRAR